MARSDAESLDAALVRLLSMAPAGAVAGARAFAAVGPACAQLRRLEGLPPVANERVLATIVEQNAQRYFLRIDTRLRTATNQIHDTGAWAFAVEDGIVTMLARACRAQRIRFQGVLPAVAALRHAITAAAQGPVSWADGSVVAHMIFADAVLQRVSRHFEADEAPSAPTVVPPLAALGAAAWRFADAYGAAASDTTDPLLIRPVRHGDGNDRLWLRTVAACALLGISAASALVLPGVVAQRRAAVARSRLAAWHERREEARRLTAQSAYVAGALARIQDFRMRRRLMTPFLARLARSTPDSTAFLTLHIDSAGGAFVVLAPSAADVLESIDGLEEIAGTHVVGAITREAAGAQQMERVAIRFRFAARGWDTRDRATRVAAQPAGGQ